MVDSLIEELKAQFPVRNLEPYGDVVIVPRSAFQHGWEKELEGEGYRVFCNVYEGQAAFFIRLFKGKPKEQVSATSKVILKGVAEQEARFVKIPLVLLESSPDAPREVYEDIDILAATIRQHGLLEPIIVVACKDKNAYRIVAGERRLRACRKAGLETIPCIVLENLTPEQIKELQLIENVQRQDLKVFEEIKIVKALRDRGLEERAIAAACGLSHGTVGNYLTIARALPVEVQRKIEKHTKDPYTLTISKALILANAKLEPHAIEEKVQLIKREGASSSVLAKEIAKEAPSKIRRVRESRSFWRELTKSLRQYAGYWSEYANLRQWETLDSYHAELHVQLPKDLKELETQAKAN